MANKSIRYGVTLRKKEAAVLKQKNAKYKCDMCGKQSVHRISVAIWKCEYCGATFAGGAYTMKTAAGETINRILSRSE